MDPIFSALFQINLLVEEITLYRKNDYLDFLTKYQSTLTKLGFWPTFDDVSGLADNILRLWSVYDLDIKDIMNGEVASEGTRPLKKTEVETIAHTANLVQMDYYHLSLLSELLNRTEDQHEKEEYQKRMNKAYYTVIMHGQKTYM